MPFKVIKTSNCLVRIYWKASLVPVATVIPAPVTCIKIAVKNLVVETRVSPACSLWGLVALLLVPYRIQSNLASMHHYSGSRKPALNSRTSTKNWQISRKKFQRVPDVVRYRQNKIANHKWHKWNIRCVFFPTNCRLRIFPQFPFLQQSLSSYRSNYGVSNNYCLIGFVTESNNINQFS